MELLEYAALYEKGLPPVAGGALDQAHGFSEACRLVWADQRYWRDKLMILG